MSDFEARQVRNSRNRRGFWFVLAVSAIVGTTVVPLLRSLWHETYVVPREHIGIWQHDGVLVDGITVLRSGPHALSDTVKVSVLPEGRLKLVFTVELGEEECRKALTKSEYFGLGKSVLPAGSPLAVKLKGEVVLSAKPDAIETMVKRSKSANFEELLHVRFSQAACLAIPSWSSKADFSKDFKIALNDRLRNVALLGVTSLELFDFSVSDQKGALTSVRLNAVEKKTLNPEPHSISSPELFRSTFGWVLALLGFELLVLPLYPEAWRCIPYAHKII